MAQMDLQIDEKPRRARGRQDDYRLIQQPRPRSLFGQVSTLLLQPGTFFRTLPAFEGSRQWLLIAVVLLAASGLMAVLQAERAAATDAAAGSGDMPPPDMGMPVDPGMGGGGGAISGDFGGLPTDMGMPVDGGAPGGQAPAEGGVSTTWTTALVAAGSLVAAWLLQALLLSEVSLFNGRAPQLGLNMQVAIYASVPLALMTGLQALYYTAGGAAGEPGLTGLVTEWTGFAGQTPFVQALLLSLASRLTLFWLWGLLLLYFGARYALRGRWWASLLVVFAWVAVIVVSPVLTGAVSAPPTEEAISAGDLPGMEGGPGMSPDARPGEPNFEGEIDPAKLEGADAGSPNLDTDAAAESEVTDERDFTSSRAPEDSVETEAETEVQPVIRSAAGG